MLASKIHLKTLYLFIFLFSGCDSFTPQKTFRLAIPKNDFSYYSSAQHLVTFLANGGFDVEVITTENAIEANRLVAKGKADLTFIMNHSDFIPEVLGKEAGNLRTISPLFERLFFFFSKDELDGKISARELFEGKKIGIEVLGGETHSNLTNLLKGSQFDNVEIVQKQDDPDFIHFWGTYYGPRATSLIEKGWIEVSLDTDLVDFITLNDEALNPFVLPAVPGIEESKSINTFSVKTLLVGNYNLSEEAIYELSEYIYQHKLELMRFDIMYRYINEKFDASTLLYPLHLGTDSYFRRDQPSFFERYAEVLALTFSIGAILYGAIQALRNSMHRRKKERIDLYFLDFLDIRTKNVNKEEKITSLDDLLQRALVQMTNEKLDITDFHIFSRLIQQELSNLR